MHVKERKLFTIDLLENNKYPLRAIIVQQRGSRYCIPQASYISRCIRRIYHYHSTVQSKAPIENGAFKIEKVE